MAIYLLKFLNDSEFLCATKCTEELIHLSDFAIFIQLPKASYTFHEMFNKKLPFAA